MASKPSDPARSTNDESVADYARREKAELAEREERKQRYWESQQRIATELPARFFQLTDQIRAEIDTFNKIVDAERRISLDESAGLAARADHAHSELNLSIHRGKAQAWVGLSELMRLGRLPPAFIIEGRVRLSQGRVRIRAEALPSGDGVRFRVMVDGHESPIKIDELGSRIVLALAKDDPTVLGAAAGPT